MATIYVDNRPCPADPSKNLLEVCLSRGFDLPYFCWHPALGSVGACRQCAVKQYKDEKDTRGRIVMACLTPVAEGTRISIVDPEAAAFRRSVIAGLMMSHPHDCPVCDEGGECHLQDMTVMTGHNYRAYNSLKRTFRNQYLGPLVNHEMNRCIQCYRCVRYYRDYAGGRDLDAFGLRDITYFGRKEDGVLESEFSGNLVEVCPTGVFTDATLKRHYTRKWDLTFAPSLCFHCGLGCNISAAARYGTLRRVVNRFHHEVNGYFLCDRGRYGYEFVNSERRIRRPVWRGEALGREEALERLASSTAAGLNVIGIGSPRASLEANFALRALVGADHFHAGMAADELRLISTAIDILRAGPAPTASLRRIEDADAVLVLGEDPTRTAPRMALALRQSVRHQPARAAEALQIPLWNDKAVRDVVQEATGPLFIATPEASRLDDVAAESFRGAPDDIARLGFAVAAALDAAAPPVAGLAPETAGLARRIADALREARQPVVISGPALGSEAVLRAASNVARALSKAGRPAALAYTAPEPNSVGLALMAERGLEPLLQATATAEAAEGAEAVNAAEDAKAADGGTGPKFDTIVILQNDLYRRAPSPAVDRLLRSARHVIALDCLANRTTERAELVLPAGSFAESDGTMVSSEGRAQRFYQVLPEQGEVREDWRWLREAMVRSGRLGAGEWPDLDGLIASLAADLPRLAPIAQAAPPASLRLAGEKIPRQPHRFSGRTSITANVSVHEPKPPEDPDSPLSFSMEGYPQQPPPAVTPFFWAPGWNSIQALNRFQEEIAGPLRGGSPGVLLINADGVGAGGRPQTGPAGGYFESIPAPFAARADQWLLVPVDRIFGSDELSMEAPGIAELAPAPHAVLAREDAARLGGVIEIEGLGRLPVEPSPSLPAGIVAVPRGLRGLPFIGPPRWVGIKAAS